MPTKKHRLMIVLSDNDLKKLELIKKSLNTKQTSKAIHILLDIYININNNK